MRKNTLGRFGGNPFTDPLVKPEGGYAYYEPPRYKMVKYGTARAFDIETGEEVPVDGEFAAALDRALKRSMRRVP